MNLRTAYLLGGLVFVLPLFLSSIAFTADAVQEPPKRDSSSCELLIDGKDIGKIALVNELGLEKVFTRPSPSEFLPSGLYRIRQIELRGGYNYYSYIDNAKDTLILGPEAPCKLKAGSPLTPGVNVKRQGRVLSLDYQLLDADGRKFINQERTNPPQFAIYQGDQKIASGSFEYGWGGTCAYSWRVPFSVVDSQLRIVTSQDIGNLGPSESQPVFYHWHWYQNVPTLPIWALIILLLVVPKANRNRQAWLILIPLGLVLIIWRMPATLLSAPPSITESLGGFIVTGTMAWSIVWLMGNRLATKNRKRSFFLIFAVMLVIGLLSYLFHFDNLNYIVIMAIAYCIYVFIIPLAMMLTSYFCRNNYSPKRFRGWLLVWIITVTLGLMLSYTMILTLIIGLEVIPVMLMSAFIGSVVIGVILYLINLPFLELALRCPLYQNRLEKIFHVYKERRLEEELDQPSSEMPPST